MKREQIIAKVIATAAKEVGVREIGNTNTGKRVEEYQAATPLGGTGWPWCAAFDSWVLLTALGEGLCDKVWKRSADCDEIRLWARRAGILSSTPTLGAAGLVMASKNDATHIFLTTKILANGINTVEGNTNDGGSRNGNGVYARTRKLTGSYLFVDWPRLLPAEVNLPDGDYKIETPTEAPNPMAGVQLWELYLSGTLVSKVALFEGRAYLPAWKWAHWFNQKLGWDAKTQTATLNGQVVPSQVRLIADEGGVRRAWVSVTALAAVTGLKVTTAAGRVMVTK